jgi:hypothetical protein
MRLGLRACAIAVREDQKGAALVGMAKRVPADFGPV